LRTTVDALRALLDLADGVLGGAREIQCRDEAETTAGGRSCFGLGCESVQRGKIGRIA